VDPVADGVLDGGHGTAPWLWLIGRRRTGSLTRLALRDRWRVRAQYGSGTPCSARTARAPLNGGLRAPSPRPGIPGPPEPAGQGRSPSAGCSSAVTFGPPKKSQAKGYRPSRLIGGS